MANLLEYADIIGRNIKITYYSQQDGRFCASLEHAEIAENSCLIGAFGNGKASVEAMNAYAADISGKTIVFNARGNDRQEFSVPMLDCI